MALPAHFMVSESDGHLYDLRKPDGILKPVRRDYRRTFAHITTGAQLRATLRAGGMTFPGGYPIVLYTNDGEMVSPSDLARDKSALSRALYDIRTEQYSRIVGADIYYEGPREYCAYTGADIDSAYGDPNAQGVTA